MLTGPLAQTVTLQPGEVVCDQTVGPLRWLTFGVATLGVLVCLTAIAYNSAAEASLTSLNRQRLQSLREHHASRGRLTEELLSRPAQVTSTIYLVHAICLIAATALSITAIHQFNLYGPEVSLMVLVLIFVVLSLGRTVPKGYALNYPEKTVLRVVGFVNLETRLFRPLVWLVNTTANGVLRLFGLKPLLSQTVVSEEEMAMLANIGEEEGLIEDDEREMIRSIFQFGDTLVREVMVPRLYIKAVSLTASLDETLDIIVNSGSSRLPVYDQDIDHIKGILYAKDLLRLLRQRATLPAFDLNSLLRPAYFVPESKKVDQLFTELQNQRVHIAIIVDEYGGTAGLATVEDLIEEIVGEIQDEYDTEVADFERVGPDEVLVDARLNLGDVNDFFQTQWESEDIETVGGFVYDRLGRIPAEGDHLLVDRQGRSLTARSTGSIELSRDRAAEGNSEPVIDYYRISVLKVSGQRLRQLRLEHLVYQAPIESQPDKSVAIDPERTRPKRTGKLTEPPLRGSKQQPLSE